MYLSALSRQAAVAIDNTRLMGRSALLQESHHRIKNNLQTIISIIKMQQYQIKNSPQVSTKQIIEDVISRIKSIAAVHDLLSKSEVGGSIINLKLLIKEIINIYIHREKPQIDVHLDDIFIPYNKATTIGLIINELINNCMKHAFENFNGALIKIDCEELENNVSIKIEDNGRGISEDFYSANTNKLGLPLVNSIVKNEFHGTLKIIINKGTIVNILIPKETLSISDGL
jgi:ribose transport system ATP-binding protein